MQTKDNKNKGNPKYYISIPIGSTVVVRWEDGGPWTHGMIEGKGSQNYHDISYHIRIKQDD